jgi:ATP-dependent RNA helicase DDX24/MAK5
LFIHFDFISDSDDEGKISNQKRRAKNSAMASMKVELKHLLSQPLIARGISTRYITSGSRLVVDDLLAGNRESYSAGLNLSLV